MKKSLVLLLVLLVSFSIVACASNAEGTTNNVGNTDSDNVDSDNVDSVGVFEEQEEREPLYQEGDMPYNIVKYGFDISYLIVHQDFSYEIVDYDTYKAFIKEYAIATNQPDKADKINGRCVTSLDFFEDEQRYLFEGLESVEEMVVSGAYYTDDINLIPYKPGWYIIENEGQIMYGFWRGFLLYYTNEEVYNEYNSGASVENVEENNKDAILFNNGDSPYVVIENDHILAYLIVHPDLYYDIVDKETYDALIEEYEPTLANSDEENIVGNIVTSDQFLNYIYDNIFDVAESEEEAIVRIAMYIDGFDSSMHDEIEKQKVFEYNGETWYTFYFRDFYYYTTESLYNKYVK